MQVAQALADLSTLRLCGPSEALALVSVHQKGDETVAQAKQLKGEQAAADEGQSASDLQRAKDLLRLHEEIKVKMARHVKLSAGTERGVDVGDELKKLRFDVQKIRAELS